MVLHVSFDFILDASYGILLRFRRASLVSSVTGVLGSLVPGGAGDDRGGTSGGRPCIAFLFYFYLFLLHGYGEILANLFAFLFWFNRSFRFDLYVLNFDWDSIFGFLPLWFA